ncbi:MAG TPA: hypothetical protein VNO35_17755, partial [Steroidobacteraceae bacterium]|nr:hypothetical protein [Steroidobacteraceae bacterium]
MKRLFLALRSSLLLCAALGPVPMLASSHEVRPAFLSVTERPDGRYDILWKQPSMGEVAVRLVPHIEGGVLDRAPSDIQSASDFRVSVWRDIDPGARALEGRTLEIEGLGETITDVLVAVTPADGTTAQGILHPQSPRMTLLVRRRIMLIKTITAFTVAHSITLAATTMHLVFVQPA